MEQRNLDKGGLGQAGPKERLWRGGIDRMIDIKQLV